jgi:hypothetical protein
MAKITVNTDLTIRPITRQTLYDMWGDAIFGQVGTSDLGNDFMPVNVGTGYSDMPASPRPGEHYWDQGQKLLFIFHDEIDSTGVSLWLASGPDRFETACLTSQPITAGALCSPVVDRWVQPYNPSESPIGNIIGANQSGLQWPAHQGFDTAASGTWVRMGIEGYMWGVFQSTSASGFHYSLIEKIPLAPNQLSADGSVIRAEQTMKTPVLDRIGWNLYAAAPQSEPDLSVRLLFLYTGFKKSRIIL